MYIIGVVFGVLGFILGVFASIVSLCVCAIILLRQRSTSDTDEQSQVNVTSFRNLR